MGDKFKRGCYVVGFHVLLLCPEVQLVVAIHIELIKSQMVELALTEKGRDFIKNVFDHRQSGRACDVQQFDVSTPWRMVNQSQNRITQRGKYW